MKRAFLGLMLGALVLTGAGCGAASSGTTPAGTVARGEASSCSSPYFPLMQGYRIAYRNTYPGGTPSAYNMEVTSVMGATTTVAIRFESGTQSTQSYSCDRGAIHALGYVDLAAGASGRSTNTETTSVSGELVPANFRVGSDWTSGFKIKANLGPAFLGAGADGRTEIGISMHRTALAEENVTVPAGTFRAIKVRSETSFDFGAVPSVPGFAAPTPVIGYEWWVEGKGIVKMTTGDDQMIVSEATEIHLP